MKIFTGILFIFIFVLGLIFGIDREVARQQYESKGGSSQCIFKVNCDHFNNL